MSLSSSDDDSLHSNSEEEESNSRSDVYFSPPDNDWYNYNPWEEQGKVESIKKYVDSSWDWACCKRNFELISYLVEHDSAWINYQNSQGITLLMIAAADNSDARGVRLLCESGAKAGICDREGRMALHFATNSGNVELLQCVLEHTDTNCIEQWFMNIPNVLQATGILHSLVGCAIHSGNVECLKILLLSSKLSMSILQAPFVRKNFRFCNIYSPVAYVFSNLVHFTDEQLDSYLQLLLNHKVTMLDEFFRVIQIQGEWPQGEIKFLNPFAKIFQYRPFSKQQHYFNWLNENEITIDHCLQCYHDNGQPFATFTDYTHYYEPVLEVLVYNNLEALKLIMSNSVILEPDQLIVHFDANYGGHQFHIFMGSDDGTEQSVVRKNMYKYLISLKPIYYKVDQLCNETGQKLSWYPYSTVGEEFSKSTLQQLCRTTIRHHVREYTLADNLRNFRKNISDLPLPSALKKFLLFES